MAYTFIDVMSTIQEQKKLAAVKRVVETAMIVALFETEVIASGSSTVYVEGDLPDPGYVDYGSVASDSSGKSDEPFITHLKKMQVRIALDDVLADRATRTGEPFKRREIVKHLRAMALNWKKFIIGRGTAGDGVSQSKEPKGIYGLINRWNPERPTNKIDFGGGTISDIKFLMDKLSLLFDEVYNPDFCLLGRKVLNNIKNLVESGATSEKMAQKITFELFKIPELDAQVRIMRYEDVPFFPVDNDSQGAEIMLADEDSGDKTSIVAVRTNPDDGVVLLREFQDMFRIKEYTLNGQDVTEITGPNALESRGPRGLSRLFNILPA